MTEPTRFIFTDTFHRMVWVGRDFRDHVVPTLPSWADCSESHPAWPWTHLFCRLCSGTGRPQLLNSIYLFSFCKSNPKFTGMLHVVNKSNFFVYFKEKNQWKGSLVKRKYNLRGFGLVSFFRLFPSPELVWLTLNCIHTRFCTHLQNAGFSICCCLFFLFLFRWLLGSPVADFSHRLGDIREVVTYPRASANLWFSGQHCEALGHKEVK